MPNVPVPPLFQPVVERSGSSCRWERTRVQGRKLARSEATFVARTDSDWYISIQFSYFKTLSKNFLTFWGPALVKIRNELFTKERYNLKLTTMVKNGDWSISYNFKWWQKINNYGHKWSMNYLPTRVIISKFFRESKVKKKH